MAEATADFELGTNGNAIQTSDAASGTAWDAVYTNSGNTAIYDNTHSYGTLAAKFDGTVTPGASCVLAWNTGIGTLTDWYARVYIYATVNPDASYRVCTDINNSRQIYVVTDGTIQMHGPGGLVTFSDTSISLNQWVRFEFHWVNSETVGQAEFRLFNDANSSTATETKSTSADKNTGASTAEMYWGLAAGGSSGVIWLDNIVAGAASWPGPVSVPSTEPQVLAMQSHVFGHNMW